jgi:hypothetical protein
MCRGGPVKLTRFQWIVLGVLSILTITVIAIGGYVLYQFNQPQFAEAPTSKQLATSEPLGLTLPPTWTPTVSPSPTRETLPTVAPSPTRDTWCDETEAMDYALAVREITDKIAAEMLAAQSVGGYSVVLSDPESTTYLALRTKEYYTTSLTFNPPPCMQTMHDYWIEYLRCRYNAFYYATQGAYSEAMTWIAKADEAITLYEQSDPFN